MPGKKRKLEVQRFTHQVVNNTDQIRRYDEDQRESALAAASSSSSGMDRDALKHQRKKQKKAAKQEKRLQRNIGDALKSLKDLTQDRSTDVEGLTSMNHKQAIKTVQEYGATQLHKRDQKRLTQEKIVRELKVAPKANQKMPLKMLVGMRKKNKFREERKRNRDKDSGLRVAPKIKTKTRSGPSLTVKGGGSFSNGVLRVKPHMFK